ncbi:hypothetical protein Q0N12_17285 [Rossellomorea marisflavi]|jgi:hypothetical protein|uniref:Uncharacterized protein n=1 Tax=Rossellomorea marisflavi TaxID=189381 RepID=A0A0M0GPH1_9BACI|nr:hypothetical protein [Rossellomorea marisflavi]KON91316.1 hypothetical protein AF331_01960 [Rossellomorea marisflavi]MCM2591822.1 hypothetical protein [Rossellomorea marisflavi]MDR4936239.1 hypothetical protein [Rossellomorea marisflavi]GLI86330.1 hypothetical protein ANABIO32_41240 [Rossellomorea marisflavi]
MEGLIFAIVIGLISAFFGRNKEKGKDQTNRPRTPNPGSNPSRSPEIEQTKARVEKQVKKSAANLQTRFEEKKATAANTITETWKEEEKQLSKQMEKTLAKAETIRKKHIDLDFHNQDDVVKGFIYSEVFGAPRSRRRHQRK